MAINISQLSHLRMALLSMLVVAGLAACASPQAAELNAESVAATGRPPGVGDCSLSNLTTLDSGHLAVAHARPRSPYYVEHPVKAPAGFDVDIADEVAGGLGFQTNQIGWRQLGPVFSPTGRPNFDIAVAHRERQRTSTTLEYSAPYFTETQVLLARPDTPISRVTSSRELAKSTLGVVRGSSSQAYVANVLGHDPMVYLSTAVLKAAMRDHYITGMVVPVEQVPAILGTFQEKLVVVGQFPPAKSARTYHLALPTGNPLVACVDSVLANLDKTGRLDELRAEWFADGVNRTIRVQ